MKNIVSIQEISEYEIKPRPVISKWRDLVRAEIRQSWAERSGWLSVACPGCNGASSAPAFDAFDVAYAECAECGTLYAPNRPSAEKLWEWYRDSVPSRFWRESVLSVSAAARTEKILRPRADWVLDGLAEYCPSASRLIDLSPHGRPLLDLLSAEKEGLTEIIAAGVTADLEGGSSGKLRVKPTPLTELAGIGQTDAMIAADVLNRAADPGALVHSLAEGLPAGGLVFATAAVASGFEIQALWDRSPTVIPPDKLNLPTIAGIQRMFAAPAWEILELSTPGMFDVELVREVIGSEDGPWPRAVRALVERTDAAGRVVLVDALQQLRLTSFARIIVRKTA